MNRKDFANGLSLLTDSEIDALYFWLRGFSRTDISIRLNFDKGYSDNLIRMSANKFGFRSGEDLLKEIPDGYYEHFKNESDLKDRRKIEEFSKSEKEPIQQEITPEEPYQPPTEEGEPVGGDEGVILNEPDDFVPEGTEEPVEPDDRPTTQNLPTAITGTVIFILVSITFIWLVNRCTAPTPIPTEVEVVLPLPTENPTDTIEPPIPTIEPSEIPTDTPVLDTPTPTITLTTGPSPTPESLLFYDDFSGGLNPDWKIVSGSPEIINDDLHSRENTWLMVGDSSWKNYQVEITIAYPIIDIDHNFGKNLMVGLHAQDIANMIGFEIRGSGGMWVKITNGSLSEYNETWEGWIDFEAFNHTIILTVQDNNYAARTAVEDLSSLMDFGFSSGGVAINLMHEHIESIKITRLQ
jgi:hypothetical protein